jgi:hypothetical protein
MLEASTVKTPQLKGSNGISSIRRFSLFRLSDSSVLDSSNRWSLQCRC